MHVRLKKRFGQNFLIDKNILNKIYNLIKFENLNILEVGPGSGNLTEFILKIKPSKLTLIEIDKDLILNLKNRFIKSSNLIIHNLDILKSGEIFDTNYDLIISNLPYNISSQALVKFCLLQNAPRRMILMFQKEFADKLLEKNLNAINSLVKCFYSIKKNFDISRNSFYPIPKVDSSLLEFTKLDKSFIEIKDIQKYFSFKRKIFNKKRKTIGSILKLEVIDFDEAFIKRRAESFSLKEFINLFNKTNS